MSKINVKGVSMYLYKGTGTTPLSVVPSGISAAKPAVVTIPDTAGLVEGMPVTMAGTGFAALDGKLFVIGTLTAGTIGSVGFELLGSDTSGSTETLGATPTASIETSTDRVMLCLSSIDIAAATVNQIDTSTFCGESTIAGRAVSGQITMGGFVDKDSAAFAELLLADEDGAERSFVIEMPSSNGFLFGAITFAGLGYEIPLEGAISFSISGSQSTKIKYVY